MQSSLLRSEPQIDDVLRKMKEYLNQVADTGKAVHLGDWWAWAALGKKFHVKKIKESFQINHPTRRYWRTYIFESIRVTRGW